MKKLINKLKALFIKDSSLSFSKRKEFFGGVSVEEVEHNINKTK